MRKPIKERKHGSKMGTVYASLLLRFHNQEVHYWGGLLYGEDNFLVDHHKNTREHLEAMMPKMIANKWIVRTRKGSARYTLAEGVAEKALAVRAEAYRKERAYLEAKLNKN